VKEPTNSAGLRGHLPSLDGWRAIAILIVIFFHSRDALIRVIGAPMAWLSPHLILAGPFGVELFFAISGLLITSRLLDEEVETGRIHLGRFYARRAFRILPASLTYLCVIAVLGTLGIIAFRFDSWIAALFFYVNFTSEPLWYVGHFWSLAVEEHFYAFWPALLIIVKPHQRFRVAVALCSLFVFWRLLNYKFAAIGIAMGSPYFQYQGRTDFQIDAILWGAVIALAYAKWSNRSWVQKFLRLDIAAALFAIAVVSLFITGNWKLIQALLIFRRLAIPVILLTTILNCRGVVKAVLEHPWLKMIGKLSYSLYLWQQLFLVWGIESLAKVAWPHLFPFNLVCVFACALASYYLIEKPLVRLGHRLTRVNRVTSPKSVTQVTA
jgi:peptidoglycan/LPS O-acetylase OafA/YrhL